MFDELLGVLVDLVFEVVLVDVICLLLGEFVEEKSFVLVEEGEFEIVGWLDVLWESGDLVIVCGVNEGVILVVELSDIFFLDLLCIKFGVLDNVWCFV